MNTIHAKLIAKKIDLLGYQTLVFQNLEDSSFKDKYIMTVVFPNWESYVPVIDDVGFLCYESVIAGKDTWYNKNTNQNIPYNYTNIIFIKFVLENKTDNLKEIIL